MRAALLIALWLLAGPAVAQEKFAGTSVDVRTILSFKVSAPSLQRLLPAGWELNPASSGPSAGANLRVTFIDQLRGTDGAGRQTAPIQYVIFSIPVKHGGVETEPLMIVTGLSPRGPGPYATNVKSANTSERRIRHELTETIVNESWECIGDDGSSVSMQLQYRAGDVVPRKVEIRNYSQVKPAFFRIYRYEGLEDTVSGAGTGAERLQKISFKARGGVLSQLFDGTEQLVGVTAVPWFSRAIYLPGS